ncbi:M48 family metalloprotease [Streptomyces tateyamensis]|uniref:M48 family metalloprotease n=1 Tax=Streptomyces tateyamensis TaxID=565073 RepID=UPI0011B3994F|nr:M48 family metalloprotease [Streptomyces tateyamensis]
MPQTITSTRPCPQCAAPIEADPRFADWCPACEWNLAPVQEPSRRRGERSRARSRARVERLYRALAARPPESDQHRSGAWVLAVLLATLVNLVTLAVLAGSLWLLVAGALVLKALALVGLGLAWLLRPRLGRWRAAEPGELTAAQAPVLHAVTARIAAALDTRTPDRIVVDHAYNASYARIGLRGRVQLTVGLPLWTALAEDERLALLGHELGHGSNGDQRRELWLMMAHSALTEWCRLLLPHFGYRFQRRGMRQAADTNLVTLFLQLLAQPVLLLLTVLNRLTERSSQQAEYLADNRAATVASSGAAERMLAKLMLHQSVQVRLGQQRSAAQRGGRTGRSGTAPVEEFWTGLREYLDSVPASERERRIRLSALEMTAVDTTHPPTHLRMRMRATRPDRAATVTVDPAEWAAIEAELAPARSRIGRQLLGW